MDFTFFIFLALVIISISLRNTKKRVRHLEEKLGLSKAPQTNTAPLQEKEPAPSHNQPVDSFPSPMPAPVSQESFTTKEAPVQQKAGLTDDFINWFKEDWLLKVGALFILLGVGFFITLAIVKGWVNEEGRIIIGMVTGVTIMLLGYWRIKSFRQQGSIFLVLGSTIFLLTVFAARELYDFFTPTTALTLMFSSSVFVAITSVRFKIESLGTTSLLLAGIAPLFTNPPTPDFIGLYSYLTVVIAGTLWVVVLTRWNNLSFAALVLAFLYSVQHISGIADPTLSFFVFSTAFSVMFTLSVIVSIYKKEGVSLQNIDVVTVLGTALFTLSWIFAALENTSENIALLVWMIAYCILGMSYYFGAHKNTSASVLFSGVGALYLGVLTSLIFDGPSMIIAYSIEIGLLVLLSYLLSKQVEIASRIAILFVLPGFMALTDDQSISLSVLTVILFALSSFFLYVLRTENEVRRVGTLLGGLYVGGIISLLSVTPRWLDNIGFEGNTSLTFFYLIEAFILFILPHALLTEKYKTKITGALTFLFAPAVMLSFGSMESSSWHTGVAHADTGVLFLTSLVFFCISFFLYFNSKGDTLLEKYVGAYSIAGSVYAFILIWLVTHAGATDQNTGTLTAMVLYTIVGLVTYLYGRIHSHHYIKRYGAVVLGLVIARLLIVDVWTLDEKVRVFTFIIIGILLTTTAFIGREKKSLENNH